MDDEVPFGDPLSDSLEFRCEAIGDDTPTSVDELVEARSLDDTDRSELIAFFGPGVDLDAFRSIDDWFFDSEPLDAEGPVMLVIDDFGGFSPCALTRGRYDVDAVAWRVLRQDDRELLVALDGCVDPDEVVADLRAHNGLTLLALWTHSAGQPCPIDDENTLGVPLPGDGDDDVQGEVLSSLVWPFVAPSPAHFRAYDPYRFTPPPSLEELAAATCTVEAGPDAVTVFWRDVAPGVTTTVVRNGVALIEANEGVSIAERFGEAAEARMFGEPAVDDVRFDGVFSDVASPMGENGDYRLRLTVGENSDVIPCGVAAIPSELPAVSCSVRSEGGYPFIAIDNPTGQFRVQLLRDGQPLDLPIGPSVGGPDLSAVDGATHAYAVVVEDGMRGRDPVRADCGSVIVSIEFGGVGELIAAEQVFARRVIGPYVYTTMAQQCEGCDEVAVDLALVFVGSAHEFTPPNDVFVSPFDIHERLIGAIEGGADVDFEIDTSTGVVTSWTIDGVGQTTSCLETDTQPPDMRPSLVCDPDNDHLD